MNRRIIMLIMMFHTLLALSYASFTIHNSDLDKSQVFSLQDLDFYVSSSTNKNVTLEYDIVVSNTTQKFSKTLFPVSCNTKGLSKYCLKDSFANYMQTSGTTFASAQKFIFKQGSQSTTIQLDFIAPIVNSEFTFDNSSKKINLNLNASDDLNFGFSSKIEITTQLNDKKISVYNLTSKEAKISKSFEIKQGGEYILTVETTDTSKNKVEIEKKLTINDSFGPRLSDFKLFEKKDNSKELTFTIEDEYNIKSWQFNSKTKVFGEIFDTKKTKQIVTTDYVFKESSIQIQVEDVLGNEEEITYKLPTLITISPILEISNTFSLTAKNAENCQIKSGMGTNVKLSKKSNTYSISVSKFKEDEYTVLIQCSRDNYVKEQEFKITVDRTPPKINSFEVLADDNGRIKLDFSYSDDTDSIKVERNGKVIDSIKKGKEEFVDYDVEYPNSYEYVIQVLDSVGNKIESESQKITPKKVEVQFEVSTQNKESSVLVSIKGEEGLKGIIQNSKNLQTYNPKNIKLSKNSKNETEFELLNSQASFEITKESTNLNLDLLAKDSFDNSETQNIRVPQKIEKIVEKESVIDKEPEKEEIVEEVVETSKIYTYILILIILLVIVVGILFLIKLSLPRLTEEYNKRKAYSKLQKKATQNQKKSKVFFDKEIERRIYEKELRHQEKIRAQDELRRKKLFQKKQDELSDYEKAKVKDLLHSKKDINFAKGSSIVEEKPEKKERLFSYSHSPLENFLSKIIDKEKHSTKEITQLPEKKIENSAKNIFSSNDTSRFKHANGKSIQKKVKEIPKKEIEPEMLVSEEKENSESFKNEKHTIDWGNYLNQRTKKNKNWFIVQKEVENETREK